jgi:hypothetical protein
MSTQEDKEDEKRRTRHAATGRVGGKRRTEGIRNRTVKVIDLDGLGSGKSSSPWPGGIGYRECRSGRR